MISPPEREGRAESRGGLGAGRGGTALTAGARGGTTSHVAVAGNAAGLGARTDDPLTVAGARATEVTLAADLAAGRGIAAERRGGLAAERRGGLAAERRGGLAAEGERGGLTAERRGGLAAERRGGLAAERRGGLAAGRRGLGAEKITKLVRKLKHRVFSDPRMT